MNIKYVTFSEKLTELTKSYYIINGNNDNVIGTVEGYGNNYGELISVVKIYTLEFQKKGLGFNAFKKIYDEINEIVPIIIIKGCWCTGGEFQDFENGISTNLKVFTDSLQTGKSIEDSAFSTPTGKWAKKLGYNNCQIIHNSIDEVHVNFFK